TQLCSTGFAGGFSVTAFRSRFTVLRISRDRGDRASPLHLGERNYTSTGPKLSKTLRSRPLIPGCEAISRERIAASPCARLSRTRTTMPNLTASIAPNLLLGLPLPTFHPP